MLIDLLILIGIAMIVLFPISIFLLFILLHDLL